MNGSAVLLLELVVRGDGVLARRRSPRRRLCRNPGTSRGTRRPRRCSPTCRPWVEVEHHRLAAQLRQLHLPVAVGGSGEIRRLLRRRRRSFRLLPRRFLPRAAFRPSAPAGPSIRRSYQARTRSQAAVHIAFEPGEVNRAGAARQAGAGRAGQHRRVAARRRTAARSRLAHAAAECSASRSSRAPCGGSTPASPSAAIVSAGSRTSRSGPRRGVAQHQVLGHEFEVEQAARQVLASPTAPARAWRGDAVAHVGDIAQQPLRVARPAERARTMRRQPLGTGRRRRRSGAPGSAPCAPMSRPTSRWYCAKPASRSRSARRRPEGRSRMSTS